MSKFLVVIFRFLVERSSIQSENKPFAEYTYISITNKKGLRLLRHSLVSLLKASDKLPIKVVVVSDGTWEPVTGKKYFDFWPGELILEDWHEVALYHKALERTTLYQYACKQIWGKKLATILKYGELGPTVYGDSDVLWFDTPQFENAGDSSQETLRLTLDNSHNYDMNLIALMQKQSVLTKPPVNCGVVYIHGNLFKKSVNLERAIAEESRSPGPFSEQTIFAIMVEEFGSTWSKEEITARMDDFFWPLLPKYERDYNKLLARHYVWVMKWLFWRDLYLFYH